MKAHVRAAAAAIALAHTLGRRVARVREYETSASCRISVSVRGRIVSGYDHGRHCYVTGALPHLYHHGERSHLMLQPKGFGIFGGFDHDTSCHFLVKVTGSEAHIFDDKEDTYFAYSV
ncbi:hypothetical protein [Bradyrhizobium sp. Cp5.3]|uniref:hypothetical protein n=1 Tax=Bradyrhizobium sp. Cp5.3 TaxID=443598 RepID=UPI00055822B7|nr:hypothetical protein [Bradyrhizobium sp. Cp5.3]